MGGFSESYLGRLRAVIGDRLVLMPGARVVIQNARGQVLLQERADFRLWGLPGGNAEIGEDLGALMVREVEEEVGLQIRALVPFGFASDPAFETITYPNGDQCQFFVMLFFTNEFSGEPKVADDESLAVGWFDIDEPPEMMPNMHRTLDAYRRFKRDGAFQLI
jgi:8-oxo-dGTP pyrophosphatase MutT (NUDIX family)